MKHEVILANKSDKKEILRFYKQQHYSARFLGRDQAYFIKENELIIACVIVSQITVNNPQAFLHALVVDKNYTRQKLASRLLHYCSQQYSIVVCFADKSLTQLYRNNGFRLSEFNELSQQLQQRYSVYYKKNQKLMPFIYP